MPKIHFENVNYETADDMPPEVRARYDKAVRMLPDRDNNGIPDLLEVDPAEVGPLPAVRAALPGVEPITPQAQKAIKLASNGMRWIRWIVLGGMLLVLACVALSFLGIIGLIKSSESYRLAVDTAVADATIQDMLGAPIHDGFMPSGSTSESGASGNAEFHIPLSGSRQSGNLAVTEVKEENTWRLESMVLEIGGQSYTIR